MAGHSKWSSIKHKKGIADKRRGQLFAKLVREITLAARDGGGDPTMNARLRLAIEKAGEANMPKDNIERAIKKGTGELPGVSYIEITYEGYGPSGVAVMVQAATDNRNRTASEIRRIFSEYGGNMGESGCVNWLFHKKGYIVIEKKEITEEDLLEKLIELDVEDMKTGEDSYEIFTSPENYSEVAKSLKESVVLETSELTMLPSTTVKLTGKDALSMMKMIDKFEDNDDVQEVFANFDIPDSEMEKIAEEL
ncbi:MAG: YebC/PmpR family DNA-binding transcriptional regulator [Elusimicrobia bacterium]|nr:YebC/PmpR family DNA-binding transcriptional regulator [Elusimicrobiota bacterium]